VAALPARGLAAEIGCWLDAGVVVVPAEVGGVAGDFILDTGAARTLLSADRALAAGFETDAFAADVRLAGVAASRAPVAAEGLDLRTWNLPTPVAGVIGTDVLGAYVVDVSFAPCRVRLSAPGAAPRLRGARRLPIAWAGGRPTVTAEAFDGERRLIGPFLIATGANAPVRLADDLAGVTGGAPPAELYPHGVWLARLPGLRLAGLGRSDLAAGLAKPEPDVAGVLGPGALAGLRLRFDFPGRRLWIAPSPPPRGKPGRPRGLVSAPRCARRACS